MSNSALADNPLTAAPFPIWVRLCGTFVAKPDDDPEWFENSRGWLPANLPDAEALATYLHEHEKAGGSVFVFDPLIADSPAMRETAQDLMYGYGLNAWAVDAASPPPQVEVIEQWPLPEKTQSPKASTESPTTT